VTAKRAITVWVTAVSSALLFIAAAHAGELAPSISPAELQTRQASDEAPVVIDVRTPMEFSSGHIPGAVNIPYDEIGARISELDAPHGVALYCMMGPRARKGEAALFDAGYRSVVHVEGGLSAWKAEGLPVER
jgi:phage shock protein E